MKEYVVTTLRLVGDPICVLRSVPLLFLLNSDAASKVDNLLAQRLYLLQVPRAASKEYCIRDI